MNARVLSINQEINNADTMNKYTIVIDKTNIVARCAISIKDTNTTIKLGEVRLSGLEAGSDDVAKLFNSLKITAFLRAEDGSSTLIHADVKNDPYAKETKLLLDKVMLPAQGWSGNSLCDIVDIAFRSDLIQSTSYKAELEIYYETEKVEFFGQEPFNTGDRWG